MSFKAMKFRVKDEQHSRQIQEVLFKMGYIWRSGSKRVKNTDDKYLYVEECGSFLCGNDDYGFISEKYTECDIEFAPVIVEVKAKRKQEIKEQIEKLTAELASL